MRKFLGKILIICSVFIGISSLASGQGVEVPSRHGKTWVYIPKPLFNIRVDEKGEVTAVPGRIGVAHSDPRILCKKIRHVSAWLNSPHGPIKNSNKFGENGLCNFNYNDCNFPFEFGNPDKQKVLEVCKQHSHIKNGWNGRLPFYPLTVTLSYYEGSHLTEELIVASATTEIELKCDPIPCEPLKLMGQFENQQFTPLPNAKEGTPYNSRLFSGGRDVDLIVSGLPPGLTLNKLGVLGGTTYARGEYRITFEIYDQCPWNPSTKRGTASLKVVETIPPRLVSFTVNPTTLPYEGGNVTVTVKATDNVSVFTVTAILVQPSGRQSGIRLPLMVGTPANGEWRTSWNIPGNDSSAPQVYTISVTVADDSDNLIRSQPVTVTVAARPSSSPPKVPRKPALPSSPGINR